MQKKYMKANVSDILVPDRFNLKFVKSKNLIEFILEFID